MYRKPTDKCRFLHYKSCPFTHKKIKVYLTAKCSDPANRHIMSLWPGLYAKSVTLDREEKNYTQTKELLYCIHPQKGDASNDGRRTLGGEKGALLGGNSG